uniref:Secreted protein n=1 Tax=Angiostrongylus cantonensis TaxID=6313 RepID=A0A0K0D5Z5_ANGCA
MDGHPAAAHFSTFYLRVFVGSLGSTDNFTPSYLSVFTGSLRSMEGYRLNRTVSMFCVWKNFLSFFLAEQASNAGPFQELHLHSVQPGDFK